MANHLNVSPQVLRINQVTASIGLSRATIYRLVKLKKFPAPIRIGVAAIGWTNQSIINFIAERDNASAKTIH